ncbi:MAG: Appr-p processing domain protein [Proteobacteria bacterium]|nr:Appr-p processing domain protein [Pseudomonadota bacterium]
MSVILNCVQGDLLRQTDCEAIVNAANTALEPGAGVCGRIHAAAGSRLADYCETLGGVAVGGAVITPGFALPQPWVIHACGPRYGFDHPEEALLTSAYQTALQLADKNEIVRIAFPAISTGVFGYPMQEAARIAIAAIRAEVPRLQVVKEVRMVLYDAVAYQVFREAMLKV